MPPDLLAYVTGAVQGYRAQHRGLAPADTDTTKAPAHDTGQHLIQPP